MNLRKYNPLRKLTWHQLNVLQVVVNALLVLVSLVTTWYARVDPVTCGFCLALVVFSTVLLVRSIRWIHESREGLERMFTALNRLETILHEAKLRREQENHDNPETKP